MYLTYVLLLLLLLLPAGCGSAWLAVVCELSQFAATTTTTITTKPQLPSSRNHFVNPTILSLATASTCSIFLYSDDMLAPSRFFLSFFFFLSPLLLFCGQTILFHLSWAWGVSFHSIPHYSTSFLSMPHYVRRLTCIILIALFCLIIYRPPPRMYIWNIKREYNSSF